MNIKDRVKYVGPIGTKVTQWLVENEVPGTVVNIRHIPHHTGVDTDLPYVSWGHDLVYVSWDGLNAASFYPDHVGAPDQWSVYENELALLEPASDESDEAEDAEDVDVFGFFFS